MINVDLVINIHELLIEEYGGIHGIRDQKSLESAIAAGFYHSVAVKSDGTVWSWGLNFYGQLGTGSNGHNNVPVIVESLCTVQPAHRAVSRQYGGTWYG